MSTAEDWPTPENDRLYSHELGLKEEARQPKNASFYPSRCVFCHLDHILSPLLSAKMRLAGETLCRESTSSNASKLAAAGRCFPSPAMPKATTTGTPSPTAATMSSGTWAALAVV